MCTLIKQDIIKNDSDVMHLPYTHSPLIFVGYDDVLNLKNWWPKFFKYVFENATWTAETKAGKEHISTTKYLVHLSFLEKYRCYNIKLVSSQVSNLNSFTIIRQHFNNKFRKILIALKMHWEILSAPLEILKKI